MKTCRLPDYQAGDGCVFDWIIQTAASVRAERRSSAALAKAKAAAAKPPRPQDPPKLSRWVKPS